MAAAGAKTSSTDIIAIESKVVNQPLTNFGSVDFISIYDASPGRAAQASKGGK